MAQQVKALATGPGDSSPIPIPYENRRAPTSQSCPLTSTRHCGMHAHIHIRCAHIIIKPEPLGLREKKSIYLFLGISKNLTQYSVFMVKVHPGMVAAPRLHPVSTVPAF